MTFLLIKILIFYIYIYSEGIYCNNLFNVNLKDFILYNFGNISLCNNKGSNDKLIIGIFIGGLTFGIAGYVFGKSQGSTFNNKLIFENTSINNQNKLLISENTSIKDQNILLKIEKDDILIFNKDLQNKNMELKHQNIGLEKEIIYKNQVLETTRRTLNMSELENQSVSAVYSQLDSKKNLLYKCEEKIKVLTNENSSQNVIIKNQKKIISKLEDKNKIREDIREDMERVIELKNNQVYFNDTGVIDSVTLNAMRNLSMEIYLNRKILLREVLVRRDFQIMHTYYIQTIKPSISNVPNYVFNIAGYISGIEEFESYESCKKYLSSFIKK
jgi:hypothetical protein